jgi:hypothetical protein
MENLLVWPEFLKNKCKNILIPEKDDFLGNSQSNNPNLKFQQNKMKFNLEFNEIYWSMKTLAEKV